MSEPQHPLNALESALQEERVALLERNIPGVLESSQAKLKALHDCEEIDLSEVDPEWISRLSAMNRENAVILARRRRDMSFLMKTMGMVDAGSTYQPDGSTVIPSHTRYFGAG